jgi:hypothetical protein
VDVGSELGMLTVVVAFRYHVEHEIHGGRQRIQIYRLTFKRLSWEAIAISRISGDIPRSEPSLRFRRILICKSEFMILSLVQACWLQFTSNSLRQRDDPSRASFDCFLRLAIPTPFSEPKILQLKILETRSNLLPAHSRPAPFHLEHFIDYRRPPAPSAG